MAVDVKLRGVFGKAYMAFIKPFPYLIVYPALMRHIDASGWHALSGGRDPAAETGISSMTRWDGPPSSRRPDITQASSSVN
jgi:Protein of unknown function (DUF2867)